MNKMKQLCHRMEMETDLDIRREQVRSYFLALEDMAERNRLLNGVDPSDEQKYNQLVSEIVDYTRYFYSMVSKMHPAVREFCNHFATTDEDTPEIREYLSDLGIDSHLGNESQQLSLFSVQSIRPRNYIMQLDSITGRLACLEARSDLNVGMRGSQPVTTTVTLDMPDHMQIDGGATLSTYDKSILNGVTSLIESGNNVFSIPMLYQAMTGRKNPTVDEGLYDELSSKLEQMRRMMISIDLGQELEAHFIDPEDGQLRIMDDPVLEGYLLPLNKISGYVAGKKAGLYQIIQYPPLYSYSKMRRQLASVPIRLLNAPLNNNSTTIPLKTYLLQRVEMMKNENNSIKSNSILYSSVYRELGAEEANKTRKMRIRNYTREILEYFVEQKYIKGFEEYKKGRSIEGVQLRL